MIIFLSKYLSELTVIFRSLGETALQPDKIPEHYSQSEIL